MLLSLKSNSTKTCNLIEFGHLTFTFDRQLILLLHFPVKLLQFQPHKFAYLLHQVNGWVDLPTLYSKKICLFQDWAKVAAG